MKTLMRAGLFSAMLALPLTASAQTDTTPKADAAPKAAGGMMMNCPMMTEIGGIQKDLGVMMSDIEGLMKDAKDPAAKETLQKIHDRVAVMMVNTQKMGGTMGNMMGGRTTQGGQQPGSSAPATPPVSPEDHQAHHPGQ